LAIALEEDLLHKLNSLYARRDSLQKELELVEANVEAVEVDLRGLRLDALQQFLHSELDEKLISFVIVDSDNNEILLSLSSSPGGEGEFARLEDALNWEDMTSVPAALLITYLGKGVPYSGI
jgi:hypothetical protein